MEKKEKESKFDFLSQHLSILFQKTSSQIIVEQLIFTKYAFRSWVRN